MFIIIFLATLLIPLFIMPIILAFKLKKKNKNKIAIVNIFGLGLIAFHPFLFVLLRFVLLIISVNGK